MIGPAHLKFRDVSHVTKVVHLLARWSLSNNSKGSFVLSESGPSWLCLFSLVLTIKNFHFLKKDSILNPMHPKYFSLFIYSLKRLGNAFKFEV